MKKMKESVSVMIAGLNNACAPGDAESESRPTEPGVKRVRQRRSHLFE